MKKQSNWKKCLALLLCTVMLLPSCWMIFSGIDGKNRVEAAAKDTVLLPDTKLPTMEVVLGGEPVYVRLVDSRAIIMGEEYRMTSDNEAIFTVAQEKDSYHEYPGWVVTGVKQGTAKLQIFKTENGKETKFATYRVNVLTQETGELGNLELPLGNIESYRYSFLSRLGKSYDYEASYTYVASNDKIVKNEAVKTGKTTVTVKQEKNGKTMTLGKVACEIKQAELNTGAITMAQNDLLGSDYNIAGQVVSIRYKCQDAVYSLKPDGKVLTLQKDGTCLASKTGTGKVTVTETYKGKSRTLGSISVTVEKRVVKLAGKAATVNKFGETSVARLVTTNTSSSFTGAADDKTILNSYDEYVQYLQPQQKGTTDVTVYEGATENRTKLGTVTVTVADTTLKTGTIKAEAWGEISGCVVNPITNYQGEYLAVEKGTKNLNRSYWDSTAYGKGTYQIYEKYQDLIVPLGTVTVNVSVFEKKTYELGPNDSRHIANFIKNYDDNATYTCTVKDKTIVKVTKNQIVPQKKGSTTVTVKVKSNGTTKSLGTITIKVVDKDAKLNVSNRLWFTYRKDAKYSLKNYIDFYHPKAIYTCKVADASVLSYDKKTQSLCIKKVGETTITVTEQYNGKTRKLGTIQIKVSK